MSGKKNTNHAKLEGIIFLNKSHDLIFALKIRYLISGFRCTTGAGVTFNNGAASSVG